MSKQMVAYRFRLYPNKEQEEIINNTFGACRFVYNHFLERRKTAYEEEGKTLSFFDCSAELTQLKKELTWLKEPSSDALKSSIRDLDFAYKNFFRGIKKGQHIGYPKFKSKKNPTQKYRVYNVKVKQNCVQLPKIGDVKCSISKAINGDIISATVSRHSSGRYYVSIVCKDVEVGSYPNTGAVIGIALGMKNLITTSDGVKYCNPRTYKKYEKRLVKLQKQLSRKKKGSNNFEKAKRKLARAYEKLSDQRSDNLHKITTQLVRDNDVLYIKKPDVQSLVKDNAVKELNKTTMDASWFEICRQLQYKADWYGKEVVILEDFTPSAQTCHVCGKVNPEVKDKITDYWICPECGSRNNRNYNTARNVLEEGLAASEKIAK